MESGAPVSPGGSPSKNSLWRLGELQQAKHVFTPGYQEKAPFTQNKKNAAEEAVGLGCTPSEIKRLVRKVLNYREECGGGRSWGVLSGGGPFLRTGVKFKKYARKGPHPSMKKTPRKSFGLESLKSAGSSRKRGVFK